MSELKPCPFCGGEPSLISFYNDRTVFPAAKVSCNNGSCKARPKVEFIDSTFEEAEDTAIEAWNTRCEPELEPIVLKDCGHYFYICPKCRSSLGSGAHYCSTCGAHIKYFGG